MRRREFLAAGLASAFPALARAQQPDRETREVGASRALPLVGILHAGSPEQNIKRVAAFKKGLAEGGFVEGRNVDIEYRWALGKNEQLPRLAADLVNRGVGLIVTPGSTAAGVAAKKATASIPIVFASGTDPVDLGLVQSLSRPGGNATGITSLNAEAAPKRLGIFRDLVPKLSRYFTLVKPSSDLAGPTVEDLERAAAGLGLKLEVLNAETVDQIDAAFAAIPREGYSGIVFGPEAFFYAHRAHIAKLALARALPTMHDVRDYVEAGGLASYGSDFYNIMELTGSYAARVLKGEKPADLPVQQATKFELVINRKTARALDLDISPALLSLADEVIE
jgi:putative tryptophan/tyrosine transport system substrate-binding protein